MINPKKIVSEKAVEYIRDGMKVGLGTGSTASFAIRALGVRVQEGLNVVCFPTSKASGQLAESLSIPLMEEHEIKKLDITIDGADEVDPDKNLIKGGGGALLREKMVGAISDQYIIIVDDSKMVNQLGAFTVPVEVVPFAWQLTAKHIEALGGETTLRESDDGFFRTDNGNFILDSDFGLIDEPETLEIQLNQIPGVVGNGLFIHMANKIICANEKGELVEL